MLGGRLSHCPIQRERQREGGKKGESNEREGREKGANRTKGKEGKKGKSGARYLSILCLYELIAYIIMYVRNSLDLFRPSLLSDSRSYSIMSFRECAHNLYKPETNRE